MFSSISWNCKSTWKKAKINTLWCLLGCSIGDFGTILFFQYTSYSLPVEQIMILAIINGLITSIILETIILSFSQSFLSAFKTAIGMSLISMIGMELSMNLVDYLITGGAMINIYVIIPMLLTGFYTPLPYNYYRLKKYNKACH
ncbi:MAG: DUF4396 domain-containing protein [Cytophagales bacterium]|nr:MAG: hypothetical protein CND83_02760 [Rhodothermaeota bacterium MED-G19]